MFFNVDMCYFHKENLIKFCVGLRRLGSNTRKVDLIVPTNPHATALG